jgi:hypothetical protein
MYLYKCKMHVRRVESLSFIWSHNFRFSMSLSLSPNSLMEIKVCTDLGPIVYCFWYVVVQILISTVMGKIQNILLMNKECIKCFWNEAVVWICIKNHPGPWKSKIEHIMNNCSCHFWYFLYCSQCKWLESRIWTSQTNGFSLEELMC